MIETRLECLEQTANRNTNSRDVAGEGSEKFSEYIIGN